MRALDSFFESGGEMPEDGAEDAPMHDDSDDHGLDEEELSRAEAGAGNCTRDTQKHARRAAQHRRARVWRAGRADKPGSIRRV